MSKTIEYLRVEDERFKVFLEGLIRYREWEEERMNTVYQFQADLTLAKPKDSSILRGTEFLVFKNLKDPSLLMKDGPLPISSV